MKWRLMYDNDDTDKDDHEDEVEDEGVHPESAISAVVFRFVDFICGSSHSPIYPFLS